jgi:MtN3 and saliva related transmembrane protein
LCYNEFRFVTKGDEVLLFADYLGLVAGALVTGSLIPQLIRVFRLKSAREISFVFTTLLLAGVAGWLAYGILLSLVPVIIWNAIAVVFAAILLYAKLKYG